jgi:fructose-bisphosphate aldolase, class II
MQVTMSPDYIKALEVGRPPNIKKLLPNSRALLVSGKAIDRGLMAKGKAMTIAANGRNCFILRGALRAAQKANAAVIIEIAKSEGGVDGYCHLGYWNLARYVDSLANEMAVTVPIAIHADHYGIKGPADIAKARVQIPSMFDAGITSIAIDASHLPDADNLLAVLELAPYVPSWAGLETEVGEIKGKEGMSTPAEASFLMAGLNAHGVFPDWIALNNGTTHGIEASEAGIQVELTDEIHRAIAPYKVSGAQHGTSGNSSERLIRIRQETPTTKANVATALQMVCWGLKVNDYGNAQLDENKNFIRVPDAGVSDEVWAAMVAFATDKGWKPGDFKKLNRPFENHLLAQPREIRRRMVQGVEAFVYHLLCDVFNAENTAPLAIEAILAADSYDLGPKGKRIEDPAAWTEEKLRTRAATLGSDKGPAGNFED